MYELPMDWIDRIFMRLQNIYGERWIKWYGHPKYQSLFKLIWSHGLFGLTSNEIRKAIVELSGYPYSAMPTLINFYHCAKGLPYHVPQNVSRET